MPSDFTRRKLIAGGVSAAALFAVSGTPALALTTAQARALIDRAVADINSVINSGRSESWMIGQFQGIFSRYADVPTIARTILGPDARSASAAEMRSYTTAFAGYMARKYGRRFREFIGGRIEVQSARPVRAFFEVKTTAILRGKAPFEVIFLVSGRSGRDLFFDLVIEGISLLKSEAVEIRAILDRNRGSIAGLVRDLERAG